PRSILLLTFTRKAAHEMLSRASRHDQRCMRVEGGTFHSFAYRMLKKYGSEIGLAKTFSILDEDDAGVAMHKCATRLGCFDKDRLFPKKETLRSVISMSVNKAAPIEDILDKEYPHFLEFAPEITSIRKEYAEYKVKNSYLDYDDLLVYLRLLLKRSEIRPKIAGKYLFLMVDEYQDTNKIQADIVYLLADRNRNVMVVGDDAQSIYGFRGTSHENIMEFPKRFSGCVIIKLEANYRSTQPILDAANAVLGNINNKYAKTLTAARKSDGVKPRLLFFKDVYEEAMWIADKVKEMRDEGLPLGHQAVLFRSAYISIPLQAELSRRNIPYQIFGGLKFYETAHVKDLIAHLRVLANPKDEISWHRILMLIDGIGPKTAERITEKLAVSGASFDKAIDEVLLNGDKAHAYSGQLKKLGACLRATIDNVGMAERYERILDHYLPLMKEKFDDWHIRVNDFDSLRQIVATYTSLTDLLADFSIEAPERGVRAVEAERKDDEGPLTLSTIHSAKGLEWEAVFLIGVADGMLPISFALNSEDDIEEEHRLFYVALTRAKTNLFLSLHHEGTRGGITQFNKISRFVDEPNVAAALDQDVVFDGEVRGDLSQETDSVFGVDRDSDSLLRDIIDSFS
ncbi:MAG: ATP-dependent helicase, partial [Candidatus Omnitrophica bacterium]|nr:ATP-dependent helicase [Candidatus Omnitrophota bacterium]